MTVYVKILRPDGRCRAGSIPGGGVWGKGIFEQKGEEWRRIVNCTSCTALVRRIRR
jgi:hypothetical protein